MNRVEIVNPFVVNPFVNLLYMRVCAVADATDEEILAVCNRDNPSANWAAVVRDESRVAGPVPCADFADRTHFMVSC